MRVLCCKTPLLAQTSSKQAVGFDLLVTHATIVTMDPARRVIEDGVLGVNGDSIAFVGSESDLHAQTMKGLTAKETVDAKGKLIIPGLINGHTHIPMVLFRGLVDDVTLDDWLRKFIFPAEAKNVTEDFVRWGSRLALAEMIRGGTTTFADMYYFEDAEAEETKAAGLRGFLGETWIDFPAPDNKSEAEMIAYTEKYLKKWQGDPLIHAVRGPAFDLYMLRKNVERRRCARPQISRADPDPRRRNAKRIDRQPGKKRNNPGAIPRVASNSSARMCSPLTVSGSITRT